MEDVGLKSRLSPASSIQVGLRYRAPGAHGPSPLGASRPGSEAKMPGRLGQREENPRKPVDSKVKPGKGGRE